MDKRNIIIAILIAVGLIGGSLYYNHWKTAQEQHAIQYEQAMEAAYGFYNIGLKDQALESFQQARDLTEMRALVLVQQGCRR